MGKKLFLTICLMILTQTYVTAANTYEITIYNETENPMYYARYSIENKTKTRSDKPKSISAKKSQTIIQTKIAYQDIYKYFLVFTPKENILKEKSFPNNALTQNIATLRGNKLYIIKEDAKLKLLPEYSFNIRKKIEKEREIEKRKEEKEEEWAKIAEKKEREWEKIKEKFADKLAQLKAKLKKLKPKKEKSLWNKFKDKIKEAEKALEELFEE